MTFHEPSEQEIAEYAYHLWESEGRIDGRDLDYWLQAKAHLTAARQHEAGLLKKNEASEPRVKRSTSSVVQSTRRKTNRKRGSRELAYA